MKLDWMEGELSKGLYCYSVQEFFAAHEHWETVWLALEEPEKTFLQAVIQVAAAFYHLQRGNPLGTLCLLRRAQSRLERYPEYFGGMDVSSLRKEIGEWLGILEAGGGTHGHSYPELRHGGPLGRTK